MDKRQWILPDSALKSWSLLRMYLTIEYFLVTIFLVWFSYLLPARHAARPRAGLFFDRYLILTDEPAIKRAIAFVDGQNLFYAAKEAFGYTYPNYDPDSLVSA